jgi:hypothetical protein
MGRPAVGVSVGLLVLDFGRGESGRTMVVALLFRVGKGLAAAAVHAFGGHGVVFLGDNSVDITVFFGVWSQWRG